MLRAVRPCVLAAAPLVVAALALVSPVAAGQVVPQMARPADSSSAFSGLALNAPFSRADTPVGDLTRDDVFYRFAVCAAYVVDTHFGENHPTATVESGLAARARSEFWSCTAFDGWPAGASPSSAFVSSPVAIAESVLAAGDADLVAVAGASDAVLRNRICLTYADLYWTMVYGLTSDNRQSPAVAETVPDSTVCVL